MNISNNPPPKIGAMPPTVQKINRVVPQKNEKKKVMPELIIRGEVRAEPKRATELQVSAENRKEKAKEKKPSVVEQKIEAREKKADPKDALEKLAAKSPAHRTFQRDHTGRIVPK